MQFELTQEYLERISEAIANSEDEFLREKMEELHYQDISAIVQELEVNQMRYILDLFPKQEGALIIRELDPEDRKKLFKIYNPDEIASFISHIDSDDAVDIINELPVKTGEEVVTHIDNKEKADHVRDLLHYDEDCAGGLMAKEVIKANINWNIKQCIEEIRRQGKNVEKIYSVYVVDDNQKLLGTVSLKKMLLSDDETLIADIYDSDIISVPSYMDAREVAETMQKYDLEVVPVVNIQGKLLGRITVDDIIDVITEQAEIDMQMMAGLSNPVEEDDTIWALSRTRLPWLLIGMMGGILGARFIGIFEEEISIIPAMAFFIPLITATGGNVGIQSSSVVVQSLARDSGINNFNIKRLFKGFLVATINGLAISSLVFTFNVVLGEEMKLAVVVSVALLSVVILSSFMGTITPLILDKMSINPALAAGPFITTANDLLGLGIYFFVAHLLFQL